MQLSDFVIFALVSFFRNVTDSVRDTESAGNNFPKTKHTLN
jgi:hypothetical protein